MPFCGAAAIAHVSASVGPMTRHVHAFGDDALGDLDAVALVDALRTGKVSRPEVIEAAIARTKAVDPALNGLAHENFDQALARASAGTASGYFDGVPTFIKDNVDVEGMPTMQGTDAWEPQPRPAHGEFARLLLGHRADSGGQDATLGVRVQRVGRASQNRGGPQSLGHRLLRGGLIVGVGGFRRRRGGADRARERRWRIHPNSGRLQRSCGSQALPRPVAAGSLVAPDADQDRHQRRSDPVGARHRRVLPGGRTHLAQPSAARRRRGHRPERPSAEDRRRHAIGASGQQPVRARSDAADRRAARGTRPSCPVPRPQPHT